MAEPTASAAVRELSIAQLAPGIVAQLTGVVTDNQSLPVINTQSGSIFADRFDQTLRWYLPTFSLVADPDPNYAFSAAQSGAGHDGLPLNRAALTFDIQAGDPPDLAAARAANPALKFQPIPCSLGATLTLPFTGDNGSVQSDSATGQAQAQPDGTQRITFNLLGPDVILAYRHLTQLGGATIALSLTYDAWQETTKVVRRPVKNGDDGDDGDGPYPWEIPHHFPTNASHMVEEASLQPAELSEVKTAEVSTPAVSDMAPRIAELPATGLSEDTVAPGPRMAETSVSSQLGVTHSVTGAGLSREVFSPPGGWTTQTITYYTWTTGQDSQTIPLAVRFFTDQYRPRYTITTEQGTHVIIDVNDLQPFATPRSEYRELTSLGAVSDRYPSFRALYLGQWSGTVVAIPASYGIVRSSTGTAALCEAAYDPASNSHCTFHFTFTLAPNVDPIDLAQLTLDLATIPEAASQRLSLTLPNGLDSRTPGNLAGFPAASATFSNGPDPHTILLEATIADNQQTPAIVSVNLFLDQLTTTNGTPLFGSVALRLDDLYPAPVEASVLLNLEKTADATIPANSDLAVSVSDGPPQSASVTNHAPFPLALGRSGVLTQGALAVNALNNTVVAPEQTAPLPGDVTGALAVLVARALSLPDPFPKVALYNYVTFHAETVQSVQHSLTVDATAVDFAGAQIQELDIQFAITALPSVAVPAVTLTPTHRVDFAHALIPVDAVVTGLTTNVTITVTAATGQKQINLTHDFLDDPILLLTTGQLS